ncbi:DEAD-box ATP-dependent RNA helicase 57 isoform X3 [Manihot esculenta]|uniref:DEAD-box ATP-dependent RNA helicase 57 isoform X3 n=1 Tax=Manihot esculenta TaxID=3983 RepID=UPI001CC811D9|nr:DEAD-box ATP-dependent RNA helicase 57 isoform X3 [Manihot esculenta]
MEKGTSFLFAGISFDKKKFANDFARFKDTKQGNGDGPTDDFNIGKRDPEDVAVSVRKRKRKIAYVSEVVEGFNVFKSSKSVSLPFEEQNDQDEENQPSRKKKELNKQIEQDALLRKKHHIHVSGSNSPSPLQNFAELSSRYGCDSYLLHNLAELGFKEPTPIQRQAIPVLLSGRECFACAPTGSGKTLAFVCPMLMKLKHASKDGIRAVILCPTRELASQTTRECKRMAKGNKFRIKLMTKELVRNADFSKLLCDILISTPLRLQLAICKKKVDLSRVEHLVLDESDKLFELGMLKQIDYVVKACSNTSVIRSLFSATLPDFVEELARTIMHDAVRVVVGRKNTASDTINQKLVYAGSEEGKLLALRQSFAERENAVDDFRAGNTWVLIATDVVARGLDFKGVNCVINFDFPDSAAAYIHRIGRSGRAGRTGEAITFYTEDDVLVLRNIANVMAASGCEVPSWIMALPKVKWRRHRPERESISTNPEDQEE